MKHTGNRTESRSRRKKASALAGVLLLCALLMTACGKPEEMTLQEPPEAAAEPQPLREPPDLSAWESAVLLEAYSNQLTEGNSIVLVADKPIDAAMYEIEEPEEGNSVMTVHVRGLYCFPTATDLLPDEAFVRDGDGLSSDGVYWDSVQIRRGAEENATDVVIGLKRKIAGSLTFSEDEETLFIGFCESPLEGQIGSQNIGENGLPTLDWKAMGKLVSLDAGHGGIDTGAIAAGADGSSVYERTINLACMKRAAELLQKAGVRLAVTRESNKTIEIKTRMALVNSFHADLSVSCHNNSEESGKAVGTEVLYSDRPDQAFFGVTGKELAEQLAAELAEQVGLRKRGCNLRNDLAMTVGTKAPGAIVEGGYMSNPTELAYMQTADFSERYGKAVAIAVIRILNKLAGVR